jgi:hypothetical protein
MQLSRRSLVVFLFATAWVPRIAAGAAPASRCRITTSGDTLTTVAPVTVDGKRLELQMTRSGAASGPHTFAFSLSRGHRILLHGQGTISATGFNLTHRFGAGVSGIHDISLTSADGQTVAGTIDRRALEPFTLGGNATALEFADKGVAPKIKLKPFLLAALRNLPTIDGSQCATGTGRTKTSRSDAAVPVPEFLGLDCTFCEAGCGLADLGCNVAALVALAGCEAGSLGAATPGCVPAYIAASAGCLKAEFECSDSCETGACCSVPCAGGTPNAASPTEFCKQTCSSGATCCGGQSNPQGTCCDQASDCCGGASSSSPTCLEGIFAGDRCVNQNTGAFCYSDEGDVCGSTAQAGHANCCPGKSPVCRDSGTGLCCAKGAGDVCGDRCCPADASQCARGGACCRPADVCGDDGDCCPAPHVCHGKTCCNPPSTTCGSACCNAAETCVDPSKSLCCGILTGVVCGDVCCDSTTQACVGGACCPRESVCGNACCGAGEYCNANDRCVACPAGEGPCRENNATSGPSTCCEAGQACCGSPLECHAPSVCAPPPPK